MARRVAINFGQRAAANRSKGRNGRGGSVGRGIQNSMLTNSDIKTVESRTDSIKKVENKNSPLAPEGQKNVIEEPVEIESVYEHATSNLQHTKTAKNGKLTNTYLNDMENTESSDGINIQIVMGFESFYSTKNKHVKGTDCYGIKFKQKTEYRQYMNREGGFNRELSPTRMEKKRIKLSLKNGPNKRQKIN